MIRELQRGPATAQAVQQATGELNQIAAHHLPKTAPKLPPKPGFRPQVGSRVRIPRLGQTAEVISGPDEDGDLTVRFGQMKLTVNLLEIESLQGEKAEPVVKPKPAPPAPTQESSDPAPAIRTSQNTLDLRGSRVADAELTLERVIANTQGPLWIIHGHGTGKLRQGVQAFLTQHPRVQQHEFAAQADGGSGVTVAYLAD